MVTHDEMDRAIGDGDQLDDGYFNALATLVPIGAIIPWAKSFTNVPALPDGWVECDGSAISDAASLLNGQNTPDLTGGEFMRGNTTSGGTGGSTTTSVVNTTGQAVDTAGTANLFGNHSHTLTPIYYDIVHIMRIK